MNRPKHIPEGYYSVTPYLTVQDAAGLVRFIEQVFDGKEAERHTRKDGLIMHTAIRIGDCPIMISDASEPMPAMPACLHVYVADVDATYRKALDAGATSEMEPADMFWGDRFASVKDRWGISWALGTHVEDVPPDELERRAREFEAQCGSPA